MYNGIKSTRVLFISVCLVMTTATPEKTDGLKALQLAIEEIDKTILSLGGVFKIQMAVIQFITKIYNRIILKGSVS